MKNLQGWLCLITIFAMGAAACSEGQARLSSPTAPTSITGSASANNGVNGAAGFGAVDVDLSGGVADSGAVATWAADHGWSTAAGGLEVEGTDVISAVSGTCPQVVIIVRGIPVTVTAATVFASGSSCAALAPGQRVEVRGILTFTLGAISVVATRLHIEDAPGGVPGARAEVEGRVASVTGVCPALTITLHGVSGAIVTNAATAFSPVGGCARIAIGMEIEAKGTLTASRELTATQVEIEDDGEGRRHIAGEGHVGNLTGTCPTLSMLVRGVRVLTTTATRFDNGRCADLRDGTKVAVEGATASNGTVTATLVRITDQPGAGGRVEGEGRVTSVQGACPALTFAVRGFTVRTTAATEFKGGLCTSIRPGTEVEVRGFKDGTVIVAERVEIDDDNDEDDSDSDSDNP